MAALLQLLPGQVFARDFQILHLLAEGGMGAVYVVTQRSTGKRRALKVMLPQLVQDARARERFAQEARIGGHIDSEHIVEVVGAGIDEDTGIPWLAMELLEGADLSHAIRERGALPLGEVHEILQQLGDGLGAAHAHGIVHRDLKPENLFIAISRRRGVPFTLKILDFGIAKLTQESRTAASTTAAVGSPMWMAPEQTEAHSRLGPATDVWALGLVAFHLITGRFYWRVANQAEVRLTALFTEVLVTPIEPASARAALLGVGHLVPPAFDGWFARCVDRDPTRRFSDARIAVAALAPVLGLRDETVPPTMEQPAARRGVPPTVPMSSSVAAAQGSYGHPAAHPWGNTPPYGGPGGSAPYGGPGGSAAPYVGPAMSAVPPQPGTTPYAVHAPSTATGALPRPPRGRGLILAAGMFAALIGAGASAFGGLLVWQRLATDPPPPRPVALHAAADAGPTDDPALDAATEVIDASTASTDVEVLAIERDAGADAGADAGRARATRPSTPERVIAESPTRFTWADGTERRWRGTWSVEGWRYAITIRLRRDAGEVTGVIVWRLLETPMVEMQPRIGSQAEETVRGAYSESARSIGLQGQRTSDPTLVQPDRYDLHLAPSGALTGLSHSESGRVSARPF